MLAQAARAKSDKPVASPSALPVTHPDPNQPIDEKHNKGKIFITSFSSQDDGPFGFLSNFFPTKFFDRGLHTQHEWTSMEQNSQFVKAGAMGLADIEWNEWEPKISSEQLRHAILIADLRDCLVRTGDYELVEVRGDDARCGTFENLGPWEGNLLGRVLMEVRAFHQKRTGYEGGFDAAFWEAKQEEYDAKVADAGSAKD
ncbi:hypothetical protein LTR42_001258 [Elasticomyces elasticus]|nr:hypothetical protein LTR42_001258 [Elasticomyces elasticus]